MQLQATLRQKRMLAESKFSDALVVWPPKQTTADSAEMRTLDSLAAGNIKSAFAEVAGTAFLRRRIPRMEVIRHINGKQVVKASSPGVLAMRNLSPGLRIARSSMAYLQFIRPLGDELSGLVVPVQPSARAKQFDVRITSAAGMPLAGVRVQALLDLEGVHAASITDAQGTATLRIPIIYPRVEAVIAEPEHTWWSVYAPGFDRVDAPRRVDLVIDPLVPDGYQLLAGYAPYDATAGEGVTVGVIDSGCGPHPALSVAGGRCLVTGEDESDWADNGIGHGTHVAGIIAAAAAPGTNVHGIAPACRLMAYRVCARTEPKDRAQSVDIAAALEQAIADQCDIVNISMGSLEAMPEVPDLLEQARNAGMLVFAATGNDGLDELRYPGRYSHTLAVGALGRDASFPDNCPEIFRESPIRKGNEFLAAFSNYGLETDFVGPGLAVISTYPHGKYAMMSGTSMAAPFSTGMAARILSKEPGILNMPRSAARADALIKLLSASARTIGWADEYEGFGVLK